MLAGGNTRSGDTEAADGENTSEHGKEPWAITGDQGEFTILLLWKVVQAGAVGGFILRLDKTAHELKMLWNRILRGRQEITIRHYGQELGELIVRCFCGQMVTNTIFPALEAGVLILLNKRSRFQALQSA